MKIIWSNYALNSDVNMLLKEETGCEIAHFDQHEEPEFTNNLFNPFLKKNH